MCDRRYWIINSRHEVLRVEGKLTQGEDGRWYIEGQPGWFWEEQNLFDNEEDAKLRAIERVLGYAVERDSPPVHQEYVRTACACAYAYAKELRNAIAEARDVAKSNLEMLDPFSPIGKDYIDAICRDYPWMKEKS